MTSNISMTSKIKLFHIFQDFTPISGVFLGHLIPTGCARSVPMKNFPGSHKYNGWRRIRRAIWQGFPWARFPSFKFTREKRINRNIFGKNWEWMMFHSSIVTIVSFYTQNYYNSKYFVKSTTTLAWIWQITQKGWFFCLILDNFTKAHFFARASLVTLGHVWEEFVELCAEQLWISSLRKVSQKMSHLVNQVH